MSIDRGKEVTIRQSLPEKQGHVTLTVKPTFRPSENGLSQDTRALGIKCHGCWIVSSDGEKTSVMQGGL